jgi:glycosyltransferase involved in cell wall biosynthesis
MRVLLINQYFPPDAAATAHIAGELASDLAKEHDVWVVAGRPSYNPEAGALAPTAAHVIRAASTAFARRTIVGRIANYASFTVAATIRACLAPRPDVVVTMTDPPTIGLVGVIASMWHRRPLVQICQDIFPDIAIALGKLRSSLVAKVWSRLNLLVRHRASKLIVVGRDMREKLVRADVPSEKVVFVPNWAEEQVAHEDELHRIRGEMNWDGSFVVMHAGNIGLAQNLSVVLEAAERLRDQPDILFVFLGDGAVKHSLVDEARRRQLSNVVFQPYLPRKDAQLVMAAADAHIVSLVPGLWGCAAPSKTYGVMAAGRPFVAAVDEGSEPARIIEEFDCGVRVPPGDSLALAAAVPELRKHGPQMGHRSLEAFRARYTRDRGTTAISTILQQCSISG